MKPTDPVSITLTGQEWNVVIAGLHEVPKRLADPLISAIQQQFQKQVEAEEAENVPVPSIGPAKGNGAAVRMND
jgi:hypothetical protein